MIIRMHATRQHNLPDIAKTSSWLAISEVLKLFEQTMYILPDRFTALNLPEGVP
jgi:hypothetical protein